MGTSDSRSAPASRLAILAALAVAAAGLGWWLLSGERAPVPASVAAPDESDPARAPLAPRPAPASRAPVPESIPASGSANVPTPPAIAPFLARVRVLDLTGAPVPDAQVLYGEFAPQGAPGGQPQMLGTPRVLYTDATGCVQVPITHARFCIEARKEGVGTSGRIPAGGDFVFHRLKDNWVLTLKPVNVVRGLVLRADGTPAPGVVVTTTSPVGSMFLELGRVLPDPATTDADGRFRFEIGWDDVYELQASHGAARTTPVKVDTMRSRGGETRDVELRFPGAFLVRGELLDPHGRPVAGEVRAFAAGEGAMFLKPWRAQPPARVEPDGRFEIVVPALGGYRLVGSARGHPDTGPIDVAVTEERPQVQLEIRLPAAGQIRGRVVWDDGQPTTEAPVTLALGDPRTEAMWGPSSRDLYGVVPAVATDAEGRFRFECVHPSLAYVLTCHAGKCGAVEREGMRANAEELLLVVSRQHAAGFALELQVFDTGGKVVPRYSVQLATQRSAGKATNVHDPQGRVTISDLSFHERYSLSVRVAGRSLPAMLRVPKADGPVLSLRVQLEELAILAVTVVDHEGRPLPQAMVRLTYPDAAGWGLVPVPADDQGRLTISNLEPGLVKVQARLPDGRVKDQDVTIAAGCVNPVELRIPKRE